jgi:hypothetical protein
LKTPPGYLFVALAGVGLYAIAAFAPLFVLPDFWTRSTIGSEIPWYFIGQAFIEGVAAAVAFLLCAILGAVAARRYGAAAWGALMPAFLFLSTQLGRGIAVLLHTRRIWAGPDAAESDWLTFADFATGTTRGQFLALAIATAVVFGFQFLGRKNLAMDVGSSDRG